jgi:hypothetical protein
MPRAAAFRQTSRNQARTTRPHNLRGNDEIETAAGLRDRKNGPPSICVLLLNALSTDSATLDTGTPSRASTR